MGDRSGRCCSSLNHQYRTAQEKLDYLIPGLRMETIREYMRHHPVVRRDVILPVSTRGIGFSTKKIYDVVTKENPPIIPSIEVQQFYRVQLALAEYKVFKNRENATIENPNLWYKYLTFNNFEPVITSSFDNFCTFRTACLLESMGMFKHDGIKYIPLFTAEQRDENQRLIPTPEQVYLTNLREVVTYLSDPTTDRDVRNNFRSKSPLPGAVWSNADVLTNPEKFIPSLYNPDDLRRDMKDVREWITAVRHHRISLHHDMFKHVVIDQNEYGNESMLVSNSSQNLRCNEGNITNRSLQGDVTEFWYSGKISDRMVGFGCYHLGGEISSRTEYVCPQYAIRSRKAASFETCRSYVDLVDSRLSF